MSDIRLSICIPTYNFGRFIGDTLSSIIAQATKEMEIVVVDGASTDNTSEIVRSFQQTFPQLRYHLLEKKGGIDQDLANSVERAQGQYCWLFSADDIMESGAVQKMLHEIKSGNDIYICNRKEADLNLNFIGVRYFLDETEQDRVYDLRNKIDLCDYLDKSTSIAAVFSYMSSIVFLREKWNNVKDDHRFIGSSYHHAFKLLSFLNQSCTLKYIRDPIVMCRLGNDSFTENSLAKRALLDINGYVLIMQRFFSEPPQINKKFRELLKKDFTATHLHSVRRMIGLKIYSSKSDWMTLRDRLYEYCGFNIRLYLVDLIPHSSLWARTVKAIRRILE